MRPEIVVPWRDSVTNASGWLVVDRLINGVCGGGTFMHANATEKEVTDLARTMSYKNSLQKIPFGGAKAGIRYDHTSPDASGVLERFLGDVKPWLETVWCTGADLNTSNVVMQRIITDMGLPSMFGALGKMIAHHTRINDQSAEIFSRMTQPMTPYFTLAEGSTGYSVARVIGMVCREKFPRVFIQGFGAVGRSLAYFLQEMNIGIIVGISDAEGVLYREEGIDCMELLNAFYTSPMSDTDSIDRCIGSSLKEKYRYQKRTCNDNEGYVIESLDKKNIDVFSPCATRYTISTKVIDSIAAHGSKILIVAGANNVFDSPVTAARSATKNIYCFPEWISNCGNALLYEELLTLPEMPHNYVAYFKEVIRKGIDSFINEAMPEASMPALWNETFIRTAKNRLSAGKRLHDAEKISYTKNLTLAI